MRLKRFYIELLPLAFQRTHPVLRPPLVHMKWLGGEENREAWFKFKSKPGQLLEGAVRDEGDHIQGTVLMEVGPRAGHLVIGRHVSASDTHYR